MERAAGDESAGALVDPFRPPVRESLAPGLERETVIASLARYRAPEALEPGDVLPG